MKNLQFSLLIDFYGDLLAPKMRDALELYYNEDLSLAEIAEEIGISRQGVRDLIKKAEEELLYLEEKLGLLGKFRSIQKKADELLEALEDTDISPDVRDKVKEFADSVRATI